MADFQEGVDNWLLYCMGEPIRNDLNERNLRFLEESLELVQAAKLTREQSHKIVDYVYDREAGDINQEVGGVMNTLAAFCNAHNLNMMQLAEREMTRCWANVDKIRAKNTAKPKF